MARKEISVLKTGVIILSFAMLLMLALSFWIVFGDGLNTMNSFLGG